MLAPYAATHQPILLLDCAKIHVGWRVFRAASGAGVWACLVPPKETYLLQPLDTHVISLLKCYLQKAAQTAQMRSPGGAFDKGALVSAVCSAIRTVMQGREWSDAFISDGFGHRQSGLSERVMNELLTAVLDVGAARPPVDVLRHCFPKNVGVPVRAV